MALRSFVAALLACSVATISLSACSEKDDAAKDPSGQSHPLIGKAAPELGAAVVGGDGPKTLQAALGKVVILDFWGTYCGPCKQSFPKYQALTEQFAGDLAVVAVSVDDPDVTTKEQLVTFAKENHGSFAILWDKEHHAAERYGMDKLTMPSSFILDQRGVVRHLHVGFHEGEEAKIAEEVEALLK